jgi:serine protease AprX
VASSSPVSQVTWSTSLCRTFKVLIAGGLIVTFAGVCAPSAAAAPSDSLRIWVFVKGGIAASEVSIHRSDRAHQRDLDRGQPLTSGTSFLSDARRELVERGIDVRLESSLLGAFSVRASQDDIEWLRTRGWVSELVAGRRARSRPADEIEAVASKAATSDAGLSETHLAMINVLPVIEAGITGEGVMLGFLDTMYDEFQHRAFSLLRTDGRIVEERDFTGQEQSNFHGLAVASVAAGRDDGYLWGPAFGATLAGATTEYVPTETPEEEEFFVAGLEWLESIGVDVVNVSLGYTTFDDPADNYTPADLDGQTAVTTRAVEAASERGVVVVVSAGNSACASPDLCWYYIGTPADAPSAITVGAVRLDSTRASFSSFGPTADGRIKPDVSAPGVGVYVAVRGDMYGRGSGTSFSAPLVAGIAAQMLQVNPGLRPSEVQEILRSTSHLAHEPNVGVGYGVVNAAKAVEEAIARRPSPLPESASISSAYPNPFTTTLTLRIDAPLDGFRGEVLIVDALGREWARPVRGTLAPGTHTVEIPTANWPSGVYIYRLTGNGVNDSGTVVRIR